MLGIFYELLENLGAIDKVFSRETTCTILTLDNVNVNYCLLCDTTCTKGLYL